MRLRRTGPRAASAEPPGGDDLGACSPGRPDEGGKLDRWPPTRAEAVPTSTTPFPPWERTDQAAALTSIRFGSCRSSAGFGTATVRTPFLKVAWIWSASTVNGRRSERAKVP